MGLGHGGVCVGVIAGRLVAGGVTLRGLGLHELHSCPTRDGIRLLRLRSLSLKQPCIIERIG